jgi:uncharacterized membrane protein YccF (DUF307 family)
MALLLWLVVCLLMLVVVVTYPYGQSEKHAASLFFKPSPLQSTPIVLGM